MPASTPLTTPAPAAPDSRTPTSAGQAAMTGSVDEFVNGWYDSSFDLRRGLWVIETDLDPAITHGIVARKRGQLGGV
jgi:hypothetical protein